MRMPLLTQGSSGPIAEMQKVLGLGGKSQTGHDEGTQGVQRRKKGALSKKKTG